MVNVMFDDDADSLAVNHQFNCARLPIDCFCHCYSGE